MKNIHYSVSVILVYLCFSLTSCNPLGEPNSIADKPSVLATTSIIGDIVSQIGGSLIDLNVLLQKGIDPHGFDPSPQDVARLIDADVLFANGAGLEEFLDSLLDNADARDKVIYVSDGIDLLLVEQDQEEKVELHTHHEYDPHTWTNPMNVIVWVENITAKLIDLDPSNAEEYQENASQYITALNALDDWIRKQVVDVPENNRNIITDHTFFSYFATEYGFSQIATLIPGSSTLAQPSAQELAVVEDLVKTYSVKAILVGNTVNPTVAERVAEDMGIHLVYIYTGSLGESGSGAESYLDYMRYNTSAIVGALKY